MYKKIFKEKKQKKKRVKENKLIHPLTTTIDIKKKKTICINDC